MARVWSRWGQNTKLWYSGETLPEAWQTGYAMSSDGSAWTRGKMLIPEGSSGAFDANSADYPSVMVDGDKFKVWYSGLNNSGDYTIGYATAEICSTASVPPSHPIYLPLVVKNAGQSCPAYYTDNFSDPASGWPVDDDSNRRYAYTDGQYQIWVKNPAAGWWATPGAKATDFTASVSARRTSGTSGAYGIRFGISEVFRTRPTSSSLTMPITASGKTTGEARPPCRIGPLPATSIPAQTGIA